MTEENMELFSSVRRYLLLMTDPKNEEDELDTSAYDDSASPAIGCRYSILKLT